MITIVRFTAPYDDDEDEDDQDTEGLTMPLPTQPAPAASSPPPDGAIDRIMTSILGRSWRTTALGILTFAAAIVPVIPGLPPLVADIARVLAPCAAGSGLALAKDHRVSGLPPN